MKATKEQRDSMLPKRRARPQEATSGTVRPHQPGQADIQSDLFYDYRTNVAAYPKWRAWMREKQPRLLVLWGKYDLSFELSEPEAYRRAVPRAEVQVLDAGHFALDTAAD
jgi:pimeloyl-ACP methyl ester carboxylesterase